MKPTFSIIVPVYNVEKYVEECLKSIFVQSYKNFEVIVINDGSTDSSLDIISKYKNNKKLSIISQENRGLSEARNIGIRNSVGDYLVFLDSDDYIKPVFLKKISDVLIQKPDVIKLEFTKLFVDHEEKIDNFVCDMIKGSSVIKDLIERKITFEPACMYVIKREFWLKNDFSFPVGTYHEDFALIPWMILNTPKFISIDNSEYMYRQSEDSIMRNKDYKKEVKKANDMLSHYDNYINLLNKSDIDKDTKKYFLSFIANGVMGKLDVLNGKEKKAFKEKLKKRKVVNNLLDDTLKRKLKKIIIKLKMR